jgi:hypothetical protein
LTFFLDALGISGDFSGLSSGDSLKSKLGNASSRAYRLGRHKT